MQSTTPGKNQYATRHFNKEFFLNSGQHPLTPASADTDTKSPAAKVFTEELQAAVELAKESWFVLAECTKAQATYANMKRGDITPYKVGDQLLLSTKNVRLKSPGARKLLPEWIGPYKVTRQVGKVNYELDLPSNLRIRDVFHVLLLRPYLSPDGEAHVHAPPPE